jgi:hypothetical protein
MNIIKCDLCKKEIEKDPVMAGFGYWGRTELCHDCGSPIIKFLKRKKLIKDGKNKVKLN